MVDRLTVLRIERTAAASALRRMQAERVGPTAPECACLDRADALSQTIDRLDSAIAQWDILQVQFA